jgi:hypothetical protein
MTTTEWAELLKQVDTLSADEQLRLAAILVERVRTHVRPIKPAPRWLDIQGIAQPSLLGEDAQAWVSRTRRESDERRTTADTRED